jgi:hypothetical protein
MSEILKPLINSDKTPNGYIELPGGLILQWGWFFAIPSVQSGSVTFPIPFPNACIGGAATPQYTQGINFNFVVGQPGVQENGFASPTGFNWFKNENTSTMTVSWFAIGH